MADAPHTLPLSVQLAAVRREIGLRRRNYPLWVARGRLTQAKADHEIAAMQAVEASLERLAASERLL